MRMLLNQGMVCPGAARPGSVHERRHQRAEPSAHVLRRSGMRGRWAGKCGGVRPPLPARTARVRGTCFCRELPCRGMSNLELRLGGARKQLGVRQKSVCAVIEKIIRVVRRHVAVCNNPCCCGCTLKCSSGKIRRPPTAVKGSGVTAYLPGNGIICLPSGSKRRVSVVQPRLLPRVQECGATQSRLKEGASSVASGVMSQGCCRA